MTSYTRCTATSPSAGHAIRMETDDPARKVFLDRPQGQRRRGRPKLRWQDGVEASAIKARIICGSPKPQSGSSAE